MAGLIQRSTRLLRHRWAEARLHSVLPAALSEQLARQVADSERRHTGQVRICIEAGLPASYVWRGASARERAVALFGKLRVWDTEDNNGVLIYLLLADRAIEIVADRALARQVPPGALEAVVAAMGEALRAGDHARALAHALDAVTAQLATHFAPGAQGADPHGNELPDAPVLGRTTLLKQ